MTENDESLSVSGIHSKFWRITLVLISAILLFAGPTYVPYGLANVLKMDYVLSISVGAALFIVGIGFMLFLVRKKIFTA